MVKTIEDIKYFIIPELYDYLKNAESGEGADITALETAVQALETAVGDAEGGLVKDVADAKVAIGNAESGLVKDVADIKAAIGDASTEGTILYRINALENPTEQTTENTEQTEP